MINFNWKHCKNILVIRLDNMGDVLMTQPAFRALKETFAGCHLTLLTSSMGAGIARLMPEVDDVLVFDSPWVKVGEKEGAAEKIQKTVKQLAKKKFDGAIIFNNFSQSALPAAMLCFLANIPKVLGYARENPYRLINYWIPDKEGMVEPIKHGVARQLELVKAIGAICKNDELSLPISERDKIRLRDNLAKEKIDVNLPYIIVHAGVSEEKRQYPMELYARVIKKLKDELGYQVILTGGSGVEKKEIDSLEKISGQEAINLAGRLDLSELSVMINEAKLLISNNTGPAHLAAALQTPVVVLYARTNPEHTPWKARARVLYFDVPKSIRSKNVTLIANTPKTSRPIPTADHIVQAAKELLSGQAVTQLPKEITVWDVLKKSANELNADENIAKFLQTK